MTIKCSVCHVKDAVILQRHSGRALCSECFIEDIRQRVFNEISKYNMFSRSDKLLLALSGGKDSYTLLDVISEIHDVSKLGVITISEGIEGYTRDEDIYWIVSRGKELGVDVVRIKFEDVVGYTLTDLVNMSRKYGVDVSPCTFCGMIRRRIINTYARELGYDRVLTAHNLDDEAQTAFINILRADVSRLLQSHPSGPKLSDLFIRRVKPLRKVYEWESALYAYLRGYKFQEVECPYIITEPTLRAKVREYFRRLEFASPGTLLKFLNLIDEVVLKLINYMPNLPELPRCSLCGEPTAHGRKVCKTCELLANVGALK